MQTFAEQFDATKGAPIQYEGRELHPSYAVPVNGGDVITLRFLRATDRPVQGVGVRCEKCQIEVAATVAKSIALWTDSAPKQVVFRIPKAKPGARVVFFNQWRDEKYGTTMYRLNNAAMQVVSQPDGSVILQCSDGWGEPDFNDLVVQVTRTTQ